VCIQVAHEAAEIAIAAYDNGLPVRVEVNHGLKNEFGIAVALDLTVFEPGYALIHQREPDSFEAVVEAAVVFHIPHEVVGDSDTQVFAKIDTKTLVVDSDVEGLGRQVEVRAVDERVIVSGEQHDLFYHSRMPTCGILRARRRHDGLATGECTGQGPGLADRRPE